MSTEEALKLEERDVRPITKQRKPCRTKKEDRIQVFEYQTSSPVLNNGVMNRYAQNSKY